MIEGKNIILRTVHPDELDKLYKLIYSIKDERALLAS